MKIIESRAPVRVCDLGGWTDTWFCKRGAVFNIAIDLYTRVKVAENDSGRIRIISEDLGIETEITNPLNIEYDGKLDLLKAAVKRMGVKTGMDIRARADCPPACGAGTSASIAVAAVGALARFTGKEMPAAEIARTAHELETGELGLESGVQDQYAAAFGGVNLMEIDYPRANVFKLPIDDKTIRELESRMIVVYLGPRSSSDMHKRVVERHRAGDGRILAAFAELETSARGIAAALTAGNLDEAAAQINRNWLAQRELHDDIATPAIAELQRLSFANGAAAFKVNGAGGGGSAFILSASGREEELKAALTRGGVKLLQSKIDFHGLQTWETDTKLRPT